MPDVRSPQKNWRPLVHIFLPWLCLLGFLSIAVFSAWKMWGDRHVTANFDMMAVELHLAFAVLPNADIGAAITYVDNEHRPVLPMALYAIDHVLFSSSGVFLQAAIFVLCFAIAWMLSDLFCGSQNGRRGRWMALSALLAFMFWLLNFENLIWPKQVHVYLGILLALWAFRRWSYSSVIDARAALVLALLGFAGSFSFGYGLIGFLALAILMLFSKASRAGHLILWGGLALTLAAQAYLSVPLKHHGDPLDHLTRVSDLLIYVAAFLGALPAQLVKSPAGLWVDTSVVVIFGFIGLGLLLLSLFLLWRRKGRASFQGDEAQRLRFAIAVILFAVATALFTAITRVEFGTLQALSFRYLYLSIFFWLGLPALLAINIRLWATRVASKITLLREVAIAVLLVALAMQVPRGLAISFNHSFQIRLGTLATILNIDNWSVQRGLWTDHEPIAKLQDYYRQTGRSIFDEAWTSSVGRQISAIYPISQETSCQTTIVRQEPLPDRPAWQQIWGFAKGDGDRADWLLIADDQGLVTGLGSFRAPPEGELEGFRDGDAFSAYLPVSPDKEQTLYLLFEGGVCPAGKL